MMAMSDGSVRSVSSNASRKRNGATSDDDVVTSMMKASPETLLRTAAEVVKDISSQSSVFQPFMEKRIPRFDPDEVCRGPVLGRGGFCVVHDISKFTPIKRNDHNHHGDDAHSTTSARSARSTRSVADEMRQLQNQSIISRLFLCCTFRRDDGWGDDSVSVGSFRTINSAMSAKTKSNLQSSRDYIISKQRKTFRNGFKHGCYVVKSVSTGLDKMGTSY